MRSPGLIDELEHAKAAIRAVVEHMPRVIKRQFGHVEARYGGRAKNGPQMLTLFALGKLWIPREHVLAIADRCA